MPPHDWSKIVSVSVVPVVIISACGLLCLAFYNRMASIVSRLRGFQRERLREHEVYVEAVRAGQEDAARQHRHQQVLRMLEIQTQRVYKRARLIRRALLCLLGATACLTACSLGSGLSLVWPRVGILAEGLFVAGMLSLLAGVLLAMAELWNALDPVHLESEFVTRLSRELESEFLKDESAEPTNGHAPGVEEKGE
jgi:hypothetical protein